jgi:hypothetical protein
LPQQQAGQAAAADLDGGLGRRRGGLQACGQPGLLFPDNLQIFFPKIHFRFIPSLSGGQTEEIKIAFHPATCFFRSKIMQKTGQIFTFNQDIS